MRPKPPWWRREARRQWERDADFRFREAVWEATDHGCRTIHLATLTRNPE